MRSIFIINFPLLLWWYVMQALSGNTTFWSNRGEFKSWNKTAMLHLAVWKFHNMFQLFLIYKNQSCAWYDFSFWDAFNSDMANKIHSTLLSPPIPSDPIHPSGYVALFQCWSIEMLETLSIMASDSHLYTAVPIRFSGCFFVCRIEIQEVSHFSTFLKEVFSTSSQTNKLSKACQLP